jgi:hypothetical protein
VDDEHRQAPEALAQDGQAGADGPAVLLGQPGAAGIGLDHAAEAPLDHVVRGRLDRIVPLTLLEVGERRECEVVKHAPLVGADLPQVGHGASP